MIRITRSILCGLRGRTLIFKNKEDICRQRQLCSTSSIMPVIGAPTSEDSRFKLGQLAIKCKLEYTCKVCSTRNSNIISKVSYTKGVVILQCSGCKNNHLLADNLGWFPDTNDKKSTK